jgi:hypothetical protein
MPAGRDRDLDQLDLAATGARGNATEAVRTITFTGESLTTMVTLTRRERHGPDRRVGGTRQRTARRGPPPRRPRETFTDDDGRFVFDDVPSGLAKFALHVPRGEEFAIV